MTLQKTTEKAEDKEKSIEELEKAERIKKREGETESEQIIKILIKMLIGEIMKGYRYHRNTKQMCDSLDTLIEYISSKYSNKYLIDEAQKHIEKKVLLFKVWTETCNLSANTLFQCLSLLSLEDNNLTTL